MTARDTRDEQLSDEEWERRLHRYANGNHPESYRVLLADHRVLKDEIKTLREERDEARRAVVEMARAQDEGLHVMEGVRNSEVVAIFEEKLVAERKRAEKAERALTIAEKLNAALMGDVKEGEDGR